MRIIATKKLMILIRSILVIFIPQNWTSTCQPTPFLRLSIEFNNDLIPRCRKLMANVRAGNTHWIYCWRSIKTFHLRYCRFVLADYREKKLHYSTLTFEISFTHILNYCINTQVSKYWFFLINSFFWKIL